MAYETKKKLESQYEDLKRDIIQYTSAFPPEESHAHVNSLKEIFSKHVNSVRQLDSADSVAELIRLLEKRLALGWFNVILFSKILEMYNMDGDINAKFINYASTLTEFQEKNKKLFYSTPYDPDLLRDVPPSREEVIPSPIAEHICNQMKDDWVEFGRLLIEKGLLVEGQLDELIDSDCTESEKTQKLLEFFVKGDRRTKRSQLLDMLTNIGLNNLKNQVDEMFMTQNENDC